jgi:ABC-2 type transport system ATP-binding protein
MQNEYAITTNKLSMKYGSQVALSNLDLKVKRGEIFGYLGHNGAGKTTTVSLLTTIARPSSGSAFVNGFNTITQERDVRQSLGYLPENVQFYENLTLMENLEYFGQLSGLKKPRKRILEVLEILEFTEPMNKRLGGFSKGMRQRVGIAQAILHKPVVLFLDEPTSGLDPEGVLQLRELILMLNKELGMTIFMNTHLLSEAQMICTEIGILKQGELIYRQSLEETFKLFKSGESLEEIYFKIDKSQLA